MVKSNQRDLIKIITNQQGQVVGAAMCTEAEDVRVEIVPLEDQFQHEVKVTKHLRTLLNSKKLALAFEGAFISSDGRLKMRNIELRD